MFTILSLFSPLANTGLYVKATEQILAKLTKTGTWGNNSQIFTQINVNLVNISKKDISDWSFKMTVPDLSLISSSWNVDLAVNDNAIIAAPNEDRQRTINVDQTISFGMILITKNPININDIVISDQKVSTENLLPTLSSLELPDIIIAMNGGLCDQMIIYVIGQQLVQKGYKVKYDLSNYSRYSYRHFELTTAFPYLDFQTASQEEIRYQKMKNSSRLPTTLQWDIGDITMPIYVDYSSIQYLHECANVGSWEYRLRLMPHYFHFEDSVLDFKNFQILKRIRQDICPVGVHVRRGDMSLEGSYWYAVPANYFIKAVKQVKERFPNASFYFFTEDKNFVLREIFLKLSDEQVQLVDLNDDKHCYKDLFLMSACKHQIRSQGTMGKIAFLLNQYSDKLLIAPEECRRFAPVIIPDIIISASNL
jgi:hypothetical protein